MEREMDDYNSPAAQIWHYIARIAAHQQRVANARVQPWG